MAQDAPAATMNNLHVSPATFTDVSCARSDFVFELPAAASDLVQPMLGPDPEVVDLIARGVGQPMGGVFDYMGDPAQLPAQALSFRLEGLHGGTHRRVA